MKRVWLLLLCSLYGWGAFAQNDDSFLSFTGSALLGGQMTVPTNTALTNVGAGDFTIEAWIKSSKTTAAFPMIFTKRTIVNNVENGMALGLFNDGKLYIRVNNVDVISTSGNLKDGQFHHVAVTRTAGRIRFYVDGSLSSNETAPNTLYATSVSSAGTGGQIYVGRDNALGGLNGITYFKGMIDDVRVWNVARSAADIANNRCNSTLLGTGLLAGWNFNAINGNAVPDYTGNNNTGQFVPSASGIPLTRYVGGLMNLCPVLSPLPIFEADELTTDSTVAFEEFANSELWLNGLGGTGCFDPNRYSELLAGGLTRRMRMGIIRPNPAFDKSCATSKAAMIVVHGGGYGNQQEQKYFKALFAENQYFAQIGYVVVVIQYRKGWDVGGGEVCTGSSLVNSSITQGFQACTGAGGLNDPFTFMKVTYQMAQDVKAAHAQLLTRTGPLGVDPNKVFYFGASTGAIAVLHAAYAADDMPLYRASPSSPTLGTLCGNMTAKVLPNAAAFASQTSNVMGVGSLAGAIHDVAWVGNNANDKIPCYLVHGSQDEAVPYCDGKIVNVCFTQSLVAGADLNHLELDGSTMIHNQVMATAGAPEKFKSYFIAGDGLNHGFFNSSNPNGSLLNQGGCYLNTLISGVFLTTLAMQTTIKSYGSSYAAGTMLPSLQWLLTPTGSGSTIYLLSTNTVPAPCLPGGFNYNHKMAAPTEPQPSFQVAPNPSAGRFQITLSPEATGKHDVTVTNAMGQVVRAAAFEGSEMGLDLSDCAAGIYWVTVQDAAGFRETLRLAKE